MPGGASEGGTANGSPKVEHLDFITKNLQDVEGHGKQLRAQMGKQNKTPRRIIYFANGESMEEYSTEEEDAEENNHEPLRDMANLSWGSYLRFWVVRIAMTTFFTCDFLGGKLATFFGLSEPKYQYAINEYYRMQEKENESDSDEDGEEMQEMEGVAASSEKQSLEIQSPRYGSINCDHASVLSQPSKAAGVN